MAQLRLVEVAAGLGVRIEAARIECRPAPVGALRHVRDEHMRVQLRVAGTARAVAKRGRDEPVAGHELGAAVPAPCDGGMALHVVERALDGGLVGVADLGA